MVSKYILVSHRREGFAFASAKASSMGKIAPRKRHRFCFSRSTYVFSLKWSCKSLGIFSFEHSSSSPTRSSVPVYRSVDQNSLPYFPKSRCGYTPAIPFLETIQVHRCVIEAMLPLVHIVPWSRGLKSASGCIRRLRSSRYMASSVSQRPCFD